MIIEMCQMNALIGDLHTNVKKHLEEIERARKEGVDFIVFPELSICGYAPEDLLLHQNFLDKMIDGLDTIVKHSQGMTVIVGLARRSSSYNEKSLLNSAAIIHDATLMGFQDKWLLPHYDVFSERRYFTHGETTRVWNIQGKRVGIVVCEDMWQNASDISNSSYPRDPVKELIPYKPDLLVNLTASPYQYMKLDTRLKVCQSAAATLRCPVVYCCQVGANSELIFDGYSMFVSEYGELLRLGKGFEEDRIKIDLSQKQRPMALAFDPMEDLFEALKLGVKDYFKKTGFSKAIIGVSGGIDSALVLTIAKEALGKENVTAVFLPSERSSLEAKKDVSLLSHNLQVKLKEISIDGLHQEYLQTVDPFFKGAIETIENLDLRIRATLLMAFSNELGSLVLNTTNKSEMALGFCTLYGDMCGSLGVIADVTKSQVFELAEWINRKGEVIPRRIIDKEPSVKSYFLEMFEEEIPDYRTIDLVIKGYVEEYRSIPEIAKIYNIPEATVGVLVRLIYQAEPKRRQSAPPLRVSLKAFGIGRRKPLTSSNRNLKEIY